MKFTKQQMQDLAWEEHNEDFEEESGVEFRKFSKKVVSDGSEDIQISKKKF